MSKLDGIEASSIVGLGNIGVGGGGITANTLAASGTQIISSANVWNNADVTSDFAIGPNYTDNTFTKIVGSRYSGQFLALKSDGTLWYWAVDSTYFLTSGTTLDGTWRQYGTDTDWTDITYGYICWLAVKGGNLMFVGDGGGRQRGDGSTSDVTSFITVNSALTWVGVNANYQRAWAWTDAGHAYATGYGYDYMTGQGNTSTIATWTREQSNLTGIVEISSARRCTWLRDSSGNVYFTGNNGNGAAGPRITSTQSRNGPVLAVDSSTDYVCAKLGGFSYHGGCHIDDSGYLRFHGEGSGLARPDNSTTDAKLGSCGLQLTSMGTGWTFYDANDNIDSTSHISAVAIKSGALWYGGASAGSVKQTLGLAVNSTWAEIRSSNVNCAAKYASSYIVLG